jgi:UDPglucose 6-dehydrogenase
MIIGVIGLGVVGAAVYRAIGNCFGVVGYDKYKEPYTDLSKVLKADVIFVCAPTPTVDGIQDLSAIDDVITTLADYNYEGVICVKSTILPKTLDMYSKEYPELKLAHNPEFLTAAKAYEDFMAQEAVIISSNNPYCLDVLQQVYNEALPRARVYLYNDFMITELAKYMRNVYLAVKVTFANEVYDLCQKLGITYDSVKEAMLSQGGIEPGHWQVPGPDGKLGYGGACFPKDTQALYDLMTEYSDINAEICKAVVEGNSKRRKFDNKCQEIN